MQVDVYSAFTFEGNGGNLAGVVYLERPINSEMKQAVAKKLGYSETVFIETSVLADFKLSFFTPESEVDLCGHATVAAFSYLFYEKKIGAGEYTQETLAGVLHVEVGANGLVKMTQSEPVFYGKIPVKTVADSLNLPRTYFEDDLLLEVVSTGIKDLLVEVPSKEILNAMTPDMLAISKVSQTYGLTGYHVFCLDDKSEDTIAYARNFAPLYGIEEEPATGTSNGALGALLVKAGQCVEPLKRGCYVKQGERMGTLSEIWVTCQSGETLKVQVGGMAKFISSTVLDLRAVMA